MMKSCSYCGRVHRAGETCPKKPKKTRDYHKNREVSVFRGDRAWKGKRDAVKSRDMHLCRLCLDGTYGDYRHAYGFRPPLEVHHIVPLEEDYSKRLDEDNLITLCPVHHKLCDANKVPRRHLTKLAKVPPSL